MTDEKRDQVYIRHMLECIERTVLHPWCKIRSTLDTQSGFDWTPDPELTGQ